MIDAMKLGPGLEEQNMETEHKFKISKFINEMDAELKDRFKALKALQDGIQDADDDESKEIRKLEVEFEKKYKEIYRMREQIVNGKLSLPAELVKEFDERAEKVKDEDYEAVEVTPCDVKAIQNSPMGVSDFWTRALINHPVGVVISEKDRPILGYLQNIELDLHEGEKGDGYDLVFTFAPNTYFDGTEIKVEFYKHETNEIKKICTPIAWKDACDPTKKKQKKKKKGKKVTVEVDQPSFFTFFKTVEPDGEVKPMKEPKEDDSEPEEDDAHF